MVGRSFRTCTRPRGSCEVEALWKTIVQQHINLIGLRANKQEIDLNDYRENNKEFTTLTIGEDGKVHGEIGYSNITAGGRTEFLSLRGTEV